MSRPAKRSVPEGMRSITRHLVCAGAADAIDYYKEAFGATGHRWSIATHQFTVSPDEVSEALSKMSGRRTGA